MFPPTGEQASMATDACWVAFDTMEQFMVDVFKAYAPYPLNRMPEWYPTMVKSPSLWQLGYRMVDGIQTPYTISRTRNGEQTRQFYVTEVKYNDTLPDGFWDPDKTANRIERK